MAAIRLSAVIGEDRQLVVKLPDDTPVGPVEVEIRPLETSTSNDREELRARLLAAGVLADPTSEELGIPKDAVPLSLEERMRIGQMPAGAPPVEDLVNEDRGNW